MNAVTVSSLARTKEHALYKYVLHWIRNPDPGSAFERAMKKLRLHLLPDYLLFRLLLALRYDGIIFLDGGVAGHIFFQRHGTNLHAFSFFLREDVRGQGRTTQMMRSLHSHCRARDLQLVRMTAGGSEIMSKIWINIADQKMLVPFRARVDLGVGWLEPLPIAA